MKKESLSNLKLIIVCLFFMSFWGKELYTMEAGAEIVPQGEKTGWSQWQQWDQFPHQTIQLGLSNSDYGAMMDLEYRCFGEVTRDNNDKKSDSYWYRIYDPEPTSEYLKVEVGCWQDDQFQATSIVNGLKR